VCPTPEKIAVGGPSEPYPLFLNWGHYPQKINLSKKNNVWNFYLPVFSGTIRVLRGGEVWGYDTPHEGPQRFHARRPQVKSEHWSLFRR